MLNSILTCLQTPSLQISSVHGCPSSLQDSPFLVRSGTHFVPSALLQPEFPPLCPAHESHVPVGVGFPEECQPPLMMPTPGSETSTVPSAETEAVPMATNWPRSWSKEYISVTSPGANP